MVKNQWLDDKTYHSVFTKTPRICVDLLLFKDNGFFLINRGIEPFKGTWAFPGGRVYHSERVINTIDRVASEELGVKCSNPTYFGYIEMPADGEFLHSISLVFITRVVSKNVNKTFRNGEIKLFDYIPENMQPYQETFLKERWTEVLKNLS